MKHRYYVGSAAFLGCGLALLLSQGSATATASSAEPAAVDSSLEEVVPLLQFRFDQLQGSQADYRTAKTFIDWEDFVELTGVLLASHSDAGAIENFDLFESIESYPIESVEAWSVRTSSLTGQELKSMSRVDAIDTTQDMLDAKAAAHGFVARRVFRDVEKWTDGSIEREFRDDNSLVITEASSQVSMLAELDHTFIDWSPALDPDSAQPGQSIEVFEDDLVYAIVFSDEAIDGELPISTKYTFDGSRGFAPLAIETRQGDATVQLIVYAYDGDLDLGMHRPAVTLHGIVREDGRVQVTLHQIDDWSLTQDDSAVDLRLPPAMLKVNLLPDHVGETAEMVFPEYLNGVPVNDYLETATQHIAAAFGTDEPSADYNRDGVVSVEDVDAAIAFFSQF